MRLEQGCLTVRQWRGHSRTLDPPSLDTPPTCPSRSRTIRNRCLEGPPDLRHLRVLQLHLSKRTLEFLEKKSLVCLVCSSLTRTRCRLESLCGRRNRHPRLGLHPSEVLVPSTQDLLSLDNDDWPWTQLEPVPAAKALSTHPVLGCLGELQTNHRRLVIRRSLSLSGPVQGRCNLRPGLLCTGSRLLGSDLQVQWRCGH